MMLHTICCLEAPDFVVSDKKIFVMFSLYIKNYVKHGTPWGRAIFATRGII